jgi:hypothetical protein
MATNASAVATAPVVIRNQASFNIGVHQDLAHGYVRGGAYLEGNGEFAFLNTSQLHVRKLASKFPGGEVACGLALLAAGAISVAALRRRRATL